MKSHCRCSRAVAVFMSACGVLQPSIAPLLSAQGAAPKAAAAATGGREAAGDRRRLASRL